MSHHAASWACRPCPEQPSRNKLTGTRSSTYFYRFLAPPGRMIYGPPRPRGGRPHRHPPCGQCPAARSGFIFRAHILGGVAVTPFRVEMRILTDFRDCCLQRLWSASLAPTPTRVPGRALRMGIARPGGMHGPGRAPKWHCDTPTPDRGPRPRPRPMATPQPAPWPRPAHATHMPRRRHADVGGWRFACYSLQRKRGWFDDHAAWVSATKITMLLKRF